MKQLNFIYIMLALSLGLNAFLTHSNGELRIAVRGSIDQLNRSSDTLEKTTHSLKRCGDVLESYILKRGIKQSTSGSNSPNIIGNSESVVLRLGETTTTSPPNSVE